MYTIKSSGREKQLTTFRKLSVIAIAALLVTGVSGLSAVAGTPKQATTSTSLTDLITTLINSVGDDTFSTIDLTTLVNTFTSTTPTPLHAISAARTQPASSSGTSTQHYGPYASSSTDSGTCGNDWANDNFDRHFTIFQNRDDGSLLVVEQFKNGSFVTFAGPSPGACDPANTPGTVNAGITGDMHGYFVIPLPTGTTQSSFDTSCVAGSPSTPCTTTGFINSHFTPACYPTTCTVTTFFFHYSAGGQGLIINEWKNASADRGGNHGDIRSNNV
jgi:hypothetical protein